MAISYDRAVGSTLVSPHQQNIYNHIFLHGLRNLGSDDSAGGISVAAAAPTPRIQMGGHRLQGDAKTVYVITAMEATKTLLGNDPALGIPIGMLSHLPAMIVQWNGAYYAIFLANPGAGMGTQWVGTAIRKLTALPSGLAWRMKREAAAKGPQGAQAGGQKSDAEHHYD